METAIEKYDICEIKYCTGCNICIQKCPKSCITFEENNLGVKYPKIDYSKCVKCNLCKQVCPSLNPVKKNETSNVFAAWSNDLNIRKKAASGGIASTLYKYAIDNGWYVCGCKFDNNLNLNFKMTNKLEEALSFNNSKYVESSLGDITKKIDKMLSDNKKVLFVGVPCQVAAVKNYINDNKKMNNLLTVDLICHGFAPMNYFKQHLKHIEKKKQCRISKVYFRDRTAKKDYSFTLYDNNGKRIYQKVVNDNDYYHLGFHKAYIYRENCYNCLYSSNSRVGDITLGDYTGLGKCTPPFEKR